MSKVSTSSLLIRAMLLTLALPCFARDVVRETAAGGINWSSGIVYATGYGTAKDSLSSAQKRILSRRAAIVDAQRNLLEITRGVRISSGLTTDAAMKQHLEVVTRVEGMIKGARSIPEKENFQNDVFAVTLVMPIAGEFLKIMLPLDQGSDSAGSDVPPDWHAALRPLQRVGDAVLDFLVPAAMADAPILIRSDDEAKAYRRLLEWMKQGGSTSVETMLQDALVSFDTNNRFSGLLIDASTVREFELATVPTIRDEHGTILYPSAATNYDDIVNKRGVTYDFDLMDAVRNERVAMTPFTIKAIRTYKNLASDLVISNEDAERVRQSPSTLQAMNKTGVLIVVPI